ncbi:MAG: outer membrane lipoprotein chaperone LolA [Vicinamibacteria bacterium]|nr:outer membrane lipoprotein chaperone LolA [Vicinamibacteria bacterium]
MNRWLAIVIAPVFLSAAGDAHSLDANRVARLVQEHHSKLLDLTASFSQTFRSGALGREIVERGVVHIKPPGRMRWEYRDPEKKLFISDGENVYFYMPADHQVVVRGQDARLGLAFALLSGRSRLLDEFDVDIETSSTGAHRLRLTPLRDDADVALLHLDVDRDGRILSIEILDPLGNRNLLRFEAIRENRGLSDRLFQFKIPGGVEVVQG